MSESEDDLLKAVAERYTKVQLSDQLSPWSASIWLTVGNQSFELATEPENEVHAEWFRKMLAKALTNLLVEQSVPPGIAFHVETALTQARMARRKVEGDGVSNLLLMRIQLGDHMGSIIEQLEEIDAKVKKGRG